MSQDGTPTPPETLQNATQADVLPLHGLALIGIYHRAEGGPLALLRMPTGEISEATTGTMVAGRLVHAIDDDALILEGPAGPTERLALLAA